GPAVPSPGFGLPFTFSWNTNTASQGFHLLTAVARDAAGNTGTSLPNEVNVTNGVLVGAGNSATFLRADTTTLGNWTGVYGRDGNVIAQHSVMVPPYAT